MHRLYLTDVPGASWSTVPVVRAVRDAMRLLAREGDPQPMASDASDLLAVYNTHRSPVLLGEADAPNVDKAIALLEDAGCEVGLDLTLIEAEPEPDVEPEDSYVVAQVALVALRFASGEPLKALHYVALLGHIAGETTEYPGIHRAAGAMLLDTFSTQVPQAAIDMMVASGQVIFQSPDDE